MRHVEPVIDAPASLTVKLDNRVPVELGAFTTSLQALATLYARHAATAGEVVNGEEVRLHIRKVEAGSIIVDLVAIAQTYSPLLTTGRSLIGFATDLKKLYDFARGKEPSPPATMDRADGKLAKDFLAAASRDPQSQMWVQAAEGAVVTVNVLNVTGLEAAGVQSRLDHWVGLERLPLTGIRRGVLFFWKQAREGDAKAGNRGIIEAISPKAIRTRFADPSMQAPMLEDALFRRAYVVDVDVQTIGGVPSLYTILAVHETIDREDV
jgi:hypothetical protein